MKILPVLIGFALIFAETRAATFESGPEQTALIELYTSESCSSCPPAERRLNALADDGRLWSDFVPVAFHVDYWDYIGWKDRFAQPAFTQRQRAYAKAWSARTVYTPCFVVNGEAVRSPTITVRDEKAGLLTATLKENHTRIEFTPEDPTLEYIAWIAPLSGKTGTRVDAGENRGRTLEHRFVALGLDSIAMKRGGKTYTATLPFERTEHTQAVAVWVSRAGSLAPIQSAGGWLE